MKYLFLVLMVIGSAGQSVFSKAYSVKSNIDAKNSPHVFNLFYSLLVASITVVTAGFSLHPSLTTWIFAAVAGIASTLYNVGIVNAANSGPYPVYTVSSVFGGVLCPAIVEFFFYDVRITVTGYIGILVIMAAIILMTRTGEKAEKLSGKFIAYCALIFATNGIFGIALLLQTKMSVRADGERSECIFITYAVAALMSLILLLLMNRRRTLSVMKLKLLPAAFILGTSASATLSRYMSLMCIQLINATLTTPIANGGVMVCVAIVSYFIFKEKQTKTQIAGDVLAVAGIVLISI